MCLPGSGVRKVIRLMVEGDGDGGGGLWESGMGVHGAATLASVEFWQGNRMVGA